MRLIDKRPKVSRRTLLKTGTVTLAAAAAMPGASKVFAAAPVAVSQTSFDTLVKMARDIYPHDRIADIHYAKVIEGLDAGVKDDAAKTAMLENGVRLLDGLSERMGHGKYLANEKEEDRVAVLKEIEKQDNAFFQTVRGALITGIYNSKELWPMFGYEGESFSKGGYLERGFDDIDWLDKV